MWQLVLMINGYFISILGCAMLAVAGYDMFINSAKWSYFINSALFSLFIGLMLFLSNRTSIKNISMRQGYLLTTTSWFSLSLLSAIPFLLYDCVPGFHDAFFEAVSGISGTGATIFADVEKLPKPILLWRSILNMMGGIGVVIFAVALLPFLGIGGMQIFQRENSDVNDKFMPKFHYIAKRIVLVYVFFLLCCIGSLYLCGMDWFDAVNHGFTTVATGGFSTKNDSIGYFNSPKIEAVIMVFMILSSLPITFYIMLMQNKFRQSIRTTQVAVFLKTVFWIVVIMALWMRISGRNDNIFSALRYVSFNVISVITTTGFASTDFLSWGAFAVASFAIISLIGGCPGSTTGSIKIFRWQVIWAFLKQSMTLAVAPKRIVPLKIKQFILNRDVVSSVLIFTTLFFATTAVFVLVLTLCGVDMFLAFSAVLGCITNVGPSIAEAIGPKGNYALFSPLVKDVLSVAMILGRLEILTVLVVFTRGFWRD